MKITTKSFKNENEIENHTLNIKPITSENLVTEVLIQANNLSAITDANLNGYITARDLNEALREVQNNLNNIATLI